MREMNRMWRGAELGITAQMRRKLERQKRKCGSGVERQQEKKANKMQVRLMICIAINTLIQGFLHEISKSGLHAPTESIHIQSAH